MGRIAIVHSRELRNHGGNSELRRKTTVADNVYSRAMRKAVALHEGKEKLARFLNVSVADIERWMVGEAPPRDIFLRVIDIILDDTWPSDDSSDAGAPSAIRDCASNDSRRP